MEVGNIAGDWLCERVLGRGNFGLVSLWVNNVNGQSRAIKKFEVSGSWDENTTTEVQKRWKREVDLLQNQIESPYIVSTAPLPAELLALQGRLPFLSMEFCSAGDLRKVLREPQNAAGLAELEVRQVLKCIGEAIAYLHSINIIHRDLKPENILLTLVNGSLVYKLSDLGFAKDLAQSDSHCSTVIGTIQYLAPEVFMGKPYDKSVDFWSFGIIAFEVCCGMRPFLHGSPVSEWIASVNTKKEGVIAIYETKDGTRAHSNKFPYNTHLSERLKQCLEMWLAMMLQTDPKRRGKRTEVEAGEGNVVGLQVLHTILEMDMLDVFCPARRLSFAVGRSTKMDAVNGWIFRDIGVPIDEQFLVTSDGKHPFTTDSPLALHQKKTNLFMIPKTLSKDGSRSCLKIPKSVAGFLQTWESFLGERLVMHRIWASIIHFVRTEVNEMEIMEEAELALRNYNDALSQRISDKKLQISVNLEQAAGIVQFEQELVKVDEEMGIEYNSSNPELQPHFVIDFDSVRKKFEEYSSEALCEINDHATETTTEDTQLRKIYTEILSSFENWRSDGEIHAMVKRLCNFIALREPIWDSKFRKLRYKMHEMHEMKRVLDKLEDLEVSLLEIKRKLIGVRREKQKYLTGHGHENYLPNSTTHDGLQNLMEESILLDIATEGTLSKSLRVANEICGTRKKLVWSFLEDKD